VRFNFEKIAVSKRKFIERTPYVRKKITFLLQIKRSQNKTKTMASDILKCGEMARRNVAIYPSNVLALDTMVASAVEKIDAFPKTRRSSRNEMIIIDNYNTMNFFFIKTHCGVPCGYLCSRIFFGWTEF
jgi:hypothetical protein